MIGHGLAMPGYRAFWGCRFVLPLMACLATLLAMELDRASLMSQLQATTRLFPDNLWACLTMAGHGSVLFALLVLADRHRPDWLLAAFISLPIVGTYSHALKALAAAPRPAAVMPPEQLYLIGERLVSASFPSGHTTSAFAVSAVVLLSGRVPPLLGTVAFALAVLVGLSRVAVGAHWPLDVLAGAGGGWLAGAAGVYLSSKLNGYQSPRILSLLLAVVVVSSSSLFFVHTGYPQAELFQYLIGGLGTLAALRWLVSLQSR